MSEQDNSHGVDAVEEAEFAGDGAPSTEDFLDMAMKMLGAEGWAGLQTSPEQMRAQTDAHRADMKREANIFRDTFSTEAGRQCLEILINRTLRRRLFGPSYETLSLENLTVASIVRETENNFVAAIIEAIAIADNRETQVRQEA